MNLKFWKRRRVVIAPLVMGPECDHLWTNWDNPVEVTVAIPASMFTSESRGEIVMTQTRKCLKCNYHQRRTL